MLNTWKLPVFGMGVQVLPLSVVVYIDVVPVVEMDPTTNPVFISVNQISSSSNPELLCFTQLFNVSTAVEEGGGVEEDELLLLQDKYRQTLKLKNRIFLIF